MQTDARRYLRERYKDVFPVPDECMIIHELEWYRVSCLTSLKETQDIFYAFFHDARKGKKADTKFKESED